MNEFCKKNGSRFFVDTSDCKIYDVGGARLNDLCGWIVPESEAESFEKGWMAGSDQEDEEFGEQWYEAILWGVATVLRLL
ncbi:MAG: hypothetical protein SOV74_02945 [Coriobacteriales bacterium]|nr:hypothetical protein [Coriobacteriales bacterium]